jgi:hypothetical protein
MLAPASDASLLSISKDKVEAMSIYAGGWNYPKKNLNNFNDSAFEIFV